MGWLLCIWYTAFCLAIFLVFKIWKIRKHFWPNLLKNHFINDVREWKVFLRSQLDRLQVGRALEISACPRSYPAFPMLLNFLCSEGAAITPTLERLFNWFDSQESWLSHAHGKTQSAYVQVCASFPIVLILGAILKNIFPEFIIFSNFQYAILLGSVLIFPTLGVYWISWMCDHARRCGLTVDRAEALLKAEICVEILIALVQSGQDPQTAWRYSFELCPASIKQNWLLDFSQPTQRKDHSKESGIWFLVGQLGWKIRGAIEWSQCAGTPLLPRMDDILSQWALELRGAQNRHLEELPFKVLKPLFVSVLPPVIILMGTIFLGVLQQSGGI